MAEETNMGAVELATELTIAWLGNQNVRAAAEDVPAFLRQMHATIEELSAPKSASSEEGPDAPVADEYPPAVSVRKSLASKDHIISMIDGKPYKTLKRHLSTHGMTPQEYRTRYKLKADYPMVAPSYSEQRRAVAKKLGLGQKGRNARTANVAASIAGTVRAAPQAKRGRAKAPAPAAPAAITPAPTKRRGRPPKKA